jgi:DNA-directed RNA polymerase specialized sigma24 family protein
MQRPALAVVAGLRYGNQSQIFNRWLIPTYQTSFRWTGDHADAEDATTWVFINNLARLRLPELVPLVDDFAANAALEAVTRHWSDRYGVASSRCSAVLTRESASDTVSTLDALFEDLSAEERLVIVLRFVRQRSLPSIAGQIGIRPALVSRYLFTTLSKVAETMGLVGGQCQSNQSGQVAAFADDLIAKRRPLRFDVAPDTWGALVAATHIQAAIAGNNLPRARFVRSLEHSIKTGRHVTPLRIWSA